MLLDAHCHLQAEEFDADREAVIARLHDRGMQCVVVGDNLSDSQKAITLAEKYEGIFAAVGLHPANSIEEEYEEQYFAKLVEHSRVVAVGEIGLDYYRMWADTPEEEKRVKQDQKDLFMQQIALAQKAQKPVIVHCRDAYDDLLKIVRTVKNVPMMIHTFLGDTKIAQQFLDCGVLLSFNGVITFEDEDPVLEAVKMVPLDRMLIETDAPHMAPGPHRGERNEPIYVEEVAKKIAELKGVQLDEVIEKTGENAKVFFRIP